MVAQNEITTITISRKLRDRLARLGSKDDTFEDILLRLVEKAEKFEKGNG